MDLIEMRRKFLRNDLIEELDEVISDQEKKVPPPPLQKPYPGNALLIDLIPEEKFNIGQESLIKIINQRKSRREFTQEPLTLEELSFLLWVTQGVKEISGDGVKTKRTVPSAGSRHPFETYLFVNMVENLKEGLYRYLPLEHKLCFLYEDKELKEKIIDACMEQKFAGECAVTFIWTLIPYRNEWRYHVFAHKAIAIDAGHICQNLYLASEAIGAGTCAIGAYNQGKMDSILGVDGKEEFTFYIAPAGKIDSD